MITDLVEKLPTHKKRKKTFFEKIKISQRETIMANIIAYYLNPREDHGLGGLFIKSLLECYHRERAKEGKAEGEADISKELKHINFDSANIWTEKPTNENNRIDILVESKQYVIVIEFKINHILNNPLGDYINFIEDKYSEVPEGNRFYIILTPNRKQPEGEAEKCRVDYFKQVILSHFIKRVEENIKFSGISLNENDPQYHFYNDFVKTIKNRRREIDMLESYQKFAEDPEVNQKLISIYDDLQKIEKVLNEKVDKLEKLVGGYTKIQSSENKLFSVIEKKADSYTVKVRLTLKGWSIEFWLEGIEQKGLKEGYEFKTPLEEVRQKVEEYERKRAQAVAVKRESGSSH
ncbi:PD-(D/E)XK nuclease family protein [Nafulsella turpanensis]|uniref:PD-(D/E)XK nuclease family protein n=1 Tax=Nafulsella turpanensis TaxID=1265690 RepID=UPI000345FCF0|nr:PD-(D/E)XK nuclease family protein [Nafulsella turpanensis]